MVSVYSVNSVNKGEPNMRKHTDEEIEKHAADCVQCLDATDNYVRAQTERIGYASRSVWLDVIDGLHEWGREHAADADCRLDERATCVACGAYHGDPCPDCGMRAYHLDGCKQI